MSAPDGPQLSIIIPVYNGEKYLADAIRSVRDQSPGPLEFLIIDDGSTDGTRELVRTLGPDCRYHYQDNAGPAAARNTGLGMARGAVIAFLDADDMLAPRGLSVRQTALLESPDLDAVMGAVQVIERQGRDEAADRFEPRGGPIICYNLGAAFFRRAVFDKIGAFDPRYRYCEDVDWFMRAQEQGIAIKVLPDVVLLYRRHENNMTHNGPAVGANLTRVLKASLDRRRNLPAATASSLDEIYYIRPGRLRV